MGKLSATTRPVRYQNIILGQATEQGQDRGWQPVLGDETMLLKRLQHAVALRADELDAASREPGNIRRSWLFATGRRSTFEREVASASESQLALDGLRTLMERNPVISTDWVSAFGESPEDSVSRVAAARITFQGDDSMVSVARPRWARNRVYAGVLDESGTVQTPEAGDLSVDPVVRAAADIVRSVVGFRATLLHGVTHGVAPLGSRQVDIMPAPQANPTPPVAPQPA